MARKISDELNAFVNELKVEPIADENIIKQIRKYKLITPLFGGGAETKKADAVKIIRETEIRGQLRFWWRAIRGVGTIKEMSNREAEIFGTSASEKDGNKLGASKVKVFVKIDNKGLSKVPFEVKEKTDRYGNVEYNDRSGKPKTIIDDKKIAPVYAVFPLRPPENEKVAGMYIPPLQVGVEFTLEISFPKNLEKDVEASIWAWETFGGIGARTRRGFGTIELLAITGTELEIKKPTSIKFAEFVTTNLTEFTNDLGGQSIDKNVPHLVLNSNFKTQIRNNPQDAWEFLIGKLKNFRQSRKPSSDPRKQGRSHWSEPDEIRRMVKKGDSLTNDFAHLPIHSITKFPRAEFGLPIVFSFPQFNEPKNTELLPTGYTRLASPLILKPVACSDGKFLALALILETSKEIFNDVHLVKQSPKKDYGRVEVHLKSGEEKLIEPMKTLGETDVLKAFLKTI
jgi:CRISPR-associated protein Cmr1